MNVKAYTLLTLQVFDTFDYSYTKIVVSKIITTTHGMYDGYP